MCTYHAKTDDRISIYESKHWLCSTKQRIRPIYLIMQIPPSPINKWMPITYIPSLEPLMNDDPLIHHTKIKEGLYTLFIVTMSKNVILIWFPWGLLGIIHT